MRWLFLSGHLNQGWDMTAEAVAMTMKHRYLEWQKIHPLEAVSSH